MKPLLGSMNYGLLPEVPDDLEEPKVRDQAFVQKRKRRRRMDR